jgi:type II secretion system protein C
MKRFIEIPRILWIANIALLLVLGYIVGGFILENGEEQSKNPDSQPEASGEQIIGSQEPVPSDNPGIIVERNIFNLSDANTSEETADGRMPETSVSGREGRLRLLATVAGDEEVACAVIENAQTKVQDLYRTGDIVEGTKIEKIDRNKIILFDGIQREVLNLYVAESTLGEEKPLGEESIAQEQDVSEAVDIISPTEREINKRAFLARVGGMEAVLKKVQVEPYKEEGIDKGVRITGLEDISMARFIGFRNGDVIQNINGSVVTNRRKAFQILRKARSQSSLEVQLLRNQEKKKLSFGIK